MDELLVRVLVNLVRVHEELGEQSFENAVHRALVAIARTVQVEAERRAGAELPSLDSQVVPFPLGASRRYEDSSAP